MSQTSIHDRIMARNQETSPEQSAAASDAATSPGKSRSRMVLSSLAGLAAIAVASLAIWQLPTVRQVFAQPAAATKNAPDQALADTPFVAHVKQAGLTTCSNVFPVLGQLLTNGAKYNLQSGWNAKEPDKHAVEAMVALDYETKDYTGSAAGLVFAAPNAATCEGIMVRVTPLASPCDTVPNSLPKGSQLSRTLGKMNIYTLPANAGQVMLVPSAQTCVAVSVATAAG